jgi:ribosomal protein S18 acetylase RimI-like enzyme
VVRDTEAGDVGAILKLLEDSRQFDSDGLAHVRSTLERHLAGSPTGIWLTASATKPLGVAYCAPEPIAAGVWNLLLLWVEPNHARGGHGRALVEHLETTLSHRNARLLVVETSGAPEFALARAFYAKRGFAHEATIRDFYSAGEDKLIFTRGLPGPAKT